jgi:hypothetical protein
MLTIITPKGVRNISLLTGEVKGTSMRFIRTKSRLGWHSRGSNLCDFLSFKGLANAPCLFKNGKSKFLAVFSDKGILSEELVLSMSELATLPTAVWRDIKDYREPFFRYDLVRTSHTLSAGLGAASAEMIFDDVSNIIDTLLHAGLLERCGDKVQSICGRSA